MVFFIIIKQIHDFLIKIKVMTFGFLQFLQLLKPITEAGLASEWESRAWSSHVPVDGTNLVSLSSPPIVRAAKLIAP